MGRATTKADLASDAEKEFGKIWQAVEALEGGRDAEILFAEEWLTRQSEAHWRRDRNVRDVLVHLVEWHRLWLHWVRENRAGRSADFLPESVSWRTYGLMNVEIRDRHQATSAAEAERMLRESHAEVMALIGELTEEELFAKWALAWTGTSTLGSYTVSVTASHYAWAIKKLKAAAKMGGKE